MLQAYGPGIDRSWSAGQTPPCFGGAVASAGTDPATWSNITALLDEDIGVQTDGFGVFQHDDQSAGGANDFVQATDADKPQVTSNGIEGDGVTEMLDGPNISSILPDAGGTMVLVAKTFTIDTDSPTTAPNVNRTLFGDTSGWMGLGFRSSNKAQFWLFDSGYKAAEAACTIGSEVIIGVYFDSSDIAIRVNDGAWSTTSAGARGGNSTALLLWGQIGFGRFAYRYKVTSSDAKTQAEIEDAILHLNARFSIF